jgi:phosphonate transport system substrate-binding protein
MKYLGDRNPGVTFSFVTTQNYADFETRLLSGGFDFALANPYQTLRAAACGYRIFGKESDDDQFRGLVITRKDAGVQSPKDLAGKTIAYPAPTAVAATMMVQYFLETHGLPIRDTRPLFLGTQEAAIQSVFNGTSQAAGTWPGAWFPYIADHPAAAADLVVTWRTPSLVNNGLVALKSAPDAIVRDVADGLFDLGRTAAGKDLLASMPVAGFEPATQKTYAPARAFIDRYEAMFGTAAALAWSCPAKS